MRTATSRAKIKIDSLCSHHLITSKHNFGNPIILFAATVQLFIENVILCLDTYIRLIEHSAASKCELRKADRTVP